MSAKKSVSRGAIRNTLESGKEFISDAGTSVTNGFAEDFFGQLLGVDFGKKSSHKDIDPLSLPEVEAFDPTKGEIFNVAKLQQLEVQTKHASDHAQKSERAKKSEHWTPGIDYRGELFAEKKISKQELREINTRVDEIMSELRKLISSSRILQVQFSETTMEQPPSEVGVYHVNFFEWLLSVIKVARQRVEDSSMWLTTIHAKSSKKQGYWGMFKKHGTSFGLSNERSVATQTG